MAVINLNDATPAAPSGTTNCKWQADNEAPRNVSTYVPILVGDSGSGGTSGAVPAPAAGDAAANKFLKADGTWAPSASSAPVVIGFILTSGAAGTNVGPMLAAPRAGSFTKCVVTVKASDGATALTFTIRQNGTAMFGSAPSIAAGASSGSVSTFTGLISSPLLVAANDVFSIDITSGSTTWQFTAQLE